MAISDTTLKKSISDLSSHRFEIKKEYKVIEYSEDIYAYVQILFDRENFRYLYRVGEPEITEEEREVVNKIIEIIKSSFAVRIEDIEKEEDKDWRDREKRITQYLENALREIIKRFSLRVGNRKIRVDKKKVEDEKLIQRLLYYVRRDLVGYGKIDVLMHDPDIEDISVDGPNIPVYIYHRRYENMETNIMWENEDELDSYVIRLAQRCGKHISVAQPVIDATLMDGSRIIMKYGREVSTRGSTFTIRKFREEPFTPIDLIKFGTMNSLMGAYFWLAVEHGMNILFVGGTASGKTTTLNALALFIKWQMKIVSIEETREVNLLQPNWIANTTREGIGGESSETGKVDMFDLLKAALRERPEYIIVGEIRGAEAYVLFQAMATGHTAYSTVHAESVPQLVSRLENKPINIPRVLIPIVDGCSIQVQTRVGGRRVRRIKEFVEIIGLDPNTGEILTNTVFSWDPKTDSFHFASKSYLLEKIMLKTNYTRERLQAELKQRQRILDWMVKQGISDFRRVARIIAEYYVNPGAIVRAMERNLSYVPSEFDKRKTKKVVKNELEAQISVLNEKIQKRIKAMKEKNEQLKKKEMEKLEKAPEKRREVLKKRFEAVWEKREERLKKFIEQQLAIAKKRMEKERKREEILKKREERKKTKQKATT